ncbi:phage tail tape measure protein [Salmonella enterica]
MGRTGPENSTYAEQYKKAAESQYAQAQKLADAQKASAKATREAEKAEREAARRAEQYTRKMADLSVAIEVQKVRASEGEQAAELYAAANQSGAKWTAEQSKAIREQSAELARLTQRADDHVKKVREQADALKDLTDASRKFNDEASMATDTAGMSDRQRQRFEEVQQIDRVFDKTDGSAAAIAARADALDALDKKYKAISVAESDWLAGAARGFEHFKEDMSDISGTISDGVYDSLHGAFDNITAMLEGNKTSWKDWGISVLKVIEKVALQMAITSAMQSATSGWGSIISGFTGFFANAKGGVYNSPSLSSFSNGVYNSPQVFAFAKGAGVFGEAGPEAIMPLTRAADGSLGVRSVATGGGGGAPTVNIAIDSNGNTNSNSSSGYEQFGRDVGRYVDQRYRELMSRDMAPGGAIWNMSKGGR